MDQIKLEDITFPVLMKEIIETQFSGIVFLNTDPWRKGIIFKEGRVCAIQSNNPSELLGHILVELGKITEEQNNNALEKARTERIKQGQVFLDEGLIQPDDLNKILRLQIEKRFLDIFTWKKGIVIRNQKTIDKSPEIGTNELSMLLRKGIMDKSPFNQVIKALSAFAEIKPKLLRDDLPADVKTEYAHISSHYVSEILLLGQDLSRIILGLYCSGYITFEESQYQPLIETLTKNLNIIKKSKPHEILNVEENISDGGLKRAYIRLVKEHHPDTYSYADEPEVKKLANEIFTEIQKAYTAFQNIREGREPEKKGLDENIQAELIFSQATDAMKAKNWQKAMDLFRLCVNMRPNEQVFAESYIKTMFMKWQKTNYGNAQELKSSIGDATKKFPNSDALYVILGWVLKQEDQPTKAIEAFKKALQLNPQNVEAQREIRLFNLRKKG